MSRKNVTKADVVKAANAIAAHHEIPTIAVIRKVLGGVGSETTLHKYLKAWKQERLLQCPDNVGSTNINLETNTKLQEFKQVIDTQQKLNEVLSKESINLGRENTQIVAINQQLLLELTATKTELKDVEHERAQLQAVNNAIVAERDIAKLYIMTEQAQQISNLKEELRVVHNKSLELVRTTSYDGHQALMDEKVKTINLQSKIDELTITIKALTAELKQTVELNEKLRIKINRQQRDSTLTWEELQAKEQAYIAREFHQETVNNDN